MAIEEEKGVLIDFDIETLKSFLPRKEVLYTILKELLTILLFHLLNHLLSLLNTSLKLLEEKYLQ